MWVRILFMHAHKKQTNADFPTLWDLATIEQRDSKIVQLCVTVHSKRFAYSTLVFEFVNQFSQELLFQFPLVSGIYCLWSGYIEGFMDRSFLLPRPSFDLKLTQYIDTLSTNCTLYTWMYIDVFCRNIPHIPCQVFFTHDYCQTIE